MLMLLIALLLPLPMLLLLLLSRELGLKNMTPFQALALAPCNQSPRAI